MSDRTDDRPGGAAEAPPHGEVRNQRPPEAVETPPYPPWDREVDARGLLCPLPVLRARKVLLAMAPGQVLRVLATDPAAVIDMPHFAQEAGHDLTASLPEGEATAYYLRRGG